MTNNGWPKKMEEKDRERESMTKKKEREREKSMFSLSHDRKLLATSKGLNFLLSSIPFHLNSEALNHCLSSMVVSSCSLSWTSPCLSHKVCWWIFPLHYYIQTMFFLYTQLTYSIVSLFSAKLATFKSFASQCCYNFIFQ